MPECAILPSSPSDSVTVGGSWSVSLTTIPIGATVSWKGDLGNAKIIADGHQLITRWDTPGTKILFAKCEQDERAFEVRVRPCVILWMETSKVLPFLHESVVITAETIPSASASSTEPERILTWSGDLGANPIIVSNGLITSWDMPGPKEVTVTCGSGATAEKLILVLDITEEESLERAEEKRREAKRNHKKASSRFNRAAFILGVVCIVAGPVAGALAGTITAIRLGGLIVGGGLVGAGAAWTGLNYSDLADDPPRDDIDVVSRFQPLHVNLPLPSDPEEASFREFLSGLLSISVCTGDLIRSLERFDGAIAAALNDGGLANGLDSVPFLPLQTAAIEHNASVGADLIRGLVSSVSSLNNAYASYMTLLNDQGADFGVEPGDVRARWRALWDEQRIEFGTQLGLSDADLADMNNAVVSSIEDVVDRPEKPPEVLIDEADETLLESMAQALDDLAVAYGQLLP
jgi:hypothetical protein